MPACILFCEQCATEQVHPLDETNFALLLTEGAVQLRCEQCGQETSWKLALPRRREPQPRRESAPRRLLVIDDDRHTLQVLQMMLRSDDYVVETAISADQAVQKLQAADFDAIVSDIRMPGFDGRSLYRFLAVYLPNYTDKVLFLTADQSEKTLRFLQESGCPYLFKPIDLNQLQSRIREIS